ncbi:iron ABC transporter permease [Staphylococcus gallinarum]|uniref:Iron ABC transporter permease n=1 Tax=Staphylococcus gallinarum TaxID=1293 RepID=A0A3A0W762_STAGA|nr:iron ABC transporter permease [Staphylococcus gallinarum]RIP36182.1 iron ABC transporter permease [Staphylococcus gallinarum]
MKYYKVVIIWGVILCITILLSLLWGLTSINHSLTQTILLEVRLPRMLEALLAGIGLTIAGHMFQTLLNNPLADSYTLGLASGATLGAGVAVTIGLSFIWIPLMSIVSSLITLAIVLSLTAIMSRGYPVRTLILSGIMIGALFNALLYLLIEFNPKKLNNIVNYMFGGFASAEYYKVIYIAIVLVITISILLSMISSIKILQLGELKAQSLGLHVRLVTYSVLILASIITAVIVAYVGVIGFIGMVIPQLVRRHFKQFNLEKIFVLNMIIGGTVMIIADWLGSIIINPYQLPASIVLALLGIPVLFYIMVTEPRLYE